MRVMYVCSVWFRCVVAVDVVYSECVPVKPPECPIPTSWIGRKRQLVQTNWRCICRWNDAIPSVVQRRQDIITVTPIGTLRFWGESPRISRPRVLLREFLLHEAAAVAAGASFRREAAPSRRPRTHHGSSTPTWSSGHRRRGSCCRPVSVEPPQLVGSAGR
jgi:hypothetical protein